MFRIACLLTLLLAPALSAEPLVQMQGNWTGSGWAREAPENPKEALRCRLKNTFDAGVLKVKGRCAASGRKVTLSGELRSKTGTDQITGHWFNPDGVGSVRLKGSQNKSSIAFTLHTNDLETGVEIARKIEWHITPEGLRLRATDYNSPKTLLSDITFMR